MVKLKKMAAIPRAEDNGKTQEKALAFKSKRKGKAELSQRCLCDSPNMWPWKFLGVTGLPISEINGVSKNWAVPGYAHIPFSPKFLMGFWSDGPCE